MKNILNTTQSPSLFLGIDLGKKDLFCHISSPFEVASHRFDNTTKGTKQLITWMKKTADPQHLSACLEQTGHYGKAVAKALYKMNIIDVYLVNPRRIKAYEDQQLRRNKSDTADAKLIAEFLESKPKKLIAWESASIDNE